MELQSNVFWKSLFWLLLLLPNHYNTLQGNMICSKCECSCTYYFKFMKNMFLCKNDFTL